MSTNFEDGKFYICSGVQKFSHDIAQWGGNRLGIEFEDFHDAKRLEILLNEGRAVLNPNLFPQMSLKRELIVA